MSTRVFCYNRQIQPECEEDLKERFGAYGEIVSFVLKPSFILVNYASSVSATEAILSENKKEYKGHLSEVREASKKPKLNPKYDAPQIRSSYNSSVSTQGRVIQTLISQPPVYAPPMPQPSPWHPYPAYHPAPQHYQPVPPTIFSQPPPNFRPSVPVEQNVKSTPAVTVNDVGIICFNPLCRTYVEQLDGQIRLMGLKVDILFPDSTMSTSTVLGIHILTLRQYMAQS